jgi:cell wall-associated NlpC family hydrolase
VADVSARFRFLQLACEQLGRPVLWGAKGDDAFDCSGLVTWCLKKVGGPDLTKVDNAQALADATRELLPEESLQPGDLLFYGVGPHIIEHVAIYSGSGVISADGATSHITSLAVALANPSNRVRRHDAIAFRHDLPFMARHRNTLVDSIDAIER